MMVLKSYIFPTSKGLGVWKNETFSQAEAPSHIILAYYSAKHFNKME